MLSWVGGGGGPVVLLSNMPSEGEMLSRVKLFFSLPFPTASQVPSILLPAFLLKFPLCCPHGSPFRGVSHLGHFSGFLPGLFVLPALPPSKPGSARALEVLLRHRVLRHTHPVHLVTS